jgi:hypothetical protein
MDVQQLQHESAGDFQYQQTLNGMEQLANWTISDDEDEEASHVQLSSKK